MKVKFKDGDTVTIDNVQAMAPYQINVSVWGVRYMDADGICRCFDFHPSDILEIAFD